MTQPESRLSAKIQKALRGKGYFCFKVHGNEMMMAGLPDIIVCADGVFIGLETKMPDKRNNVSVRQAYVHEKIRNANGGCYVVCSEKEALRKVADHLNHYWDGVRAND